jgi:hypothetical protein
VETCNAVCNFACSNPLLSDQINVCVIITLIISVLHGFPFVLLCASHPPVQINYQTMIYVECCEGIERMLVLYNYFCHNLIFRFVYAKGDGKILVRINFHQSIFVVSHSVYKATRCNFAVAVET